MWGAIASAVAGAVASGAMNWASSKDTASANNAFSADMANTQYQRAVADMRKAGLNPMLAGLRASGNASPTGSQVNPMPGNSLNAGIQTAINSAISYGQLENQVNQTNSTINLNTQQSNLLKQQAVSEIAKQQQIQANTALTLQQAKQAEEATRAISLENEKSALTKLPYEIANKALERVQNLWRNSANDKPKGDNLTFSQALQELRQDAVNRSNNRSSSVSTSRSSSRNTRSNSYLYHRGISSSR